MGEVPASNLCGRAPHVGPSHGPRRVMGPPGRRARAPPPSDHPPTKRAPAEIERLHRLEELGSTPKRSRAARTAHLVRTEREEVTTERLHVDPTMRRSLRRGDGAQPTPPP